MSLIGPGQAGPQISPDELIEAVRDKKVMCVVIELADGVAFHTADNLTPQGLYVLIEVLENGIQQLKAQLKPPGRA